MGKHRFITAAAAVLLSAPAVLSSTSCSSDRAQIIDSLGVRDATGNPFQPMPTSTVTPMQEAAMPQQNDVDAEDSSSMDVADASSWMDVRVKCPDAGSGPGAGLDATAGDADADAGASCIYFVGCTPLYSWGPLTLPENSTFTLQITCGAPKSAVFATCTDEAGNAYPNMNYGATNGSGDFNFRSAPIQWNGHTSLNCMLSVGASVVGTFMFSPG